MLKKHYLHVRRSKDKDVELHWSIRNGRTMIYVEKRSCVSKTRSPVRKLFQGSKFPRLPAQISPFNRIYIRVYIVVLLSSSETDKPSRLQLLHEISCINDTNPRLPRILKIGQKFADIYCCIDGFTLLLLRIEIPSSVISRKVTFDF